MSKQIDERVVEMQFDNKQFESNVRTSMSTLEKLKQSLRFKDASKGFDNLDKASKKVDMTHLGKALDSVKVKFSALEVMGMTALANITNSALNAGKKIASAFTIDPIKSGFQEYETQINAVQTILANTESKGSTLQDVNNALAELNTYADKTIYNFTEMTRNIGTFTAAGVDLNTSVQAIKGIANLAAVSGSTSQQASTAMYQLSQALAAGTVKLMDWNSVVNAGMGGQVFQDSLKETARVHGIAIDAMIKKEGSFRETLQNGWLSSEILTETLAKFTGDLSEQQLKTMGYTEEQIKGIIKMGETANDAATKVKTFTQLFDTLKEAAQSGWTKSWELIIGDFGEAKELLTDISDMVGKVIGNSADRRNDMLLGGLSTGWKQLLNEGIHDAAGFEETITNVAKQHGVDMSSMINDENDFQDVLKKTFKDGTLSSDVLSESISKFSEKVSGMSQAELEAAGYTSEHVKKLKELDEKVKNGSISMEKFAELIVRPSGRELLIESLWNSLKGLESVIAPISQAFREIFPAVTGEQLYSLIEKLRDFTAKLKLSSEQSENLKSTFKGIFSVFSLVGKVITGVVKGFASLIGAVLPAGNGILSFTGMLGNFVSKINESINVTNILSKAFDLMVKVVKPVANVIGKVISGIAEGFKKLGNMDIISKFVNGIKTAITAIGTVIQKLISELSGGSGFEALKNLFNEGLFAAILLGINKFIKSLTSVTDKLGGGSIGFVDSIKNTLGGIKDSMTDFIDSFKDQQKINTLKSLAVAIGILSASLFVLSRINPDQMTNALGGLTIALSGLFAFLVAFENVFKDSKFKSLGKVSMSLIALSVAILILAAAMKVMSSMSWDEIARGLAGTVVGLGALVGAVNLLPESKITKAAKAMGKLAVALLILSAAIKIMSSMSWMELERGFSGMAVGLGLLIGALHLLPKDMGKGAISMIAIASAMVILSGALKIMSTMSWDDIARSLAVLAGSLLSIALAMNFMTGALPGAAALLVVSASLIVLSGALKIMATMSWEDIARGLTVLAGSLLTIALAMAGMTGALPGAAALLVVAASLAVLTPVLLALGNMSWDSIIKGLTAIAGAFLIFGIAGVALGPLVPVLFGLSGAIALFGIGCLAAGAGILALSAGLTGLAAVGVAAAASIVGTIEILTVGILSLIPKIVDQLTAAIVSLCDVIIQSAPAIGEALKALLLTAIDVLVTCSPQLVDGLISLFVNVVSALAARMPEILDVIVDFLVALINGISYRISDLISAGVNLCSAIIQGIIDAVGPIIETVITPILEFIKSIIVGIVEAIAPYIPNIQAAIEAICSAFTTLVTSIAPIINSITQLVAQLGNSISQVLQSIANVISTCGNTIAQVFQSIADVISTCGYAISQVLESIADTIGTVFTGISDVINSVGESIRNVLDGIADVISAIGEAALNAGTGFENLANGVKTITDLKLTDMVASLAAVAKGIKDIASNSKGLAEVGSGMKEIESATKISASAFNTMATGIQTVKTAISSIGQIASSSMSVLVSSVSASTSCFSTLSSTVQMSVASIISSLSSCANVVQNSGIAIMNGLRNGIVSGSTAIKTDIVNLLNIIMNTIKSKVSAFQNAGKTLATSFAKGIQNGKSSVTSATTALINAAKTTAKSGVTGFETIGKSIGEGLARGIRNSISTAVAAAKDLSSSTATAAKTDLRVNSPSKVFMAIGSSVVEGFAKGITDNIGDSNKAAINMSKSVLLATQKELGIHSPSVVFNKEVGRYIVQGVAEGIEEDTSAEDAAKKKAQNIVDAFKTELDKIDLESSIAEKTLKLWGLNEGKDASTEAKNDKQIALYNSEIARAKREEKLAHDEWVETKNYFDENSKEVKEAFDKYLDAQIKVQENAQTLLDFIKENRDSIKELEEELVDSKYDLWVSVNQNVSDNLKTEKQLAYLKELSAIATEEMLENEKKYQKNLKELGEDSIDTKNALKAWLESQKEVADLTNEMNKVMLESRERARESIDLSRSIDAKKYELWEESNSKTASDAQKDTKKIEDLNNQLTYKNKVLRNLNSDYLEAVKNYGKQSNKAKEALEAVLDTEIEIAEIKNEISDVEKNAIEREKERIETQLDLASESSNLRYQIWEKTQGRDATSIEKSVAKLMTLNDQLIIQTNILENSRLNYLDVVKEYGESSNEASSAYNEYLKEQLELAELQNEIADINEQTIEKEKNARSEYNKYLEKYKKYYLENGMTLNDLENDARLVSGYDPNDTVSDMINSTAKSLSSINSDSKYKNLLTNFSNVGTSYVNAINNSVGDSISTVIDTTTDMMTQCSDLINDNTPVWSEAGCSLVVSLATGIRSKVEETIGAVTFVINATVANIWSKQQSFVQAGAYLVDGFAMGIRNNSYKAINAAIDLARATKEAIESELEIASPSKVFASIGRYAAIGLANGLIDNSGISESAASYVGNRAIDSLKETIKLVSEAVGSDMNIQPTIRPVLDLSDVEAGTARLNSRLSRSLAIGIDSGMHRETVGEIQNGVNIPNNGGNTYQFTQNNYSPKALSRTEIYRQTRNQFSAMKGALV